VTAVKTDHRVTTPQAVCAVTDLVKRIPVRERQRIRTGHGTKGDRHHEWAMITIQVDIPPTATRTGTAPCWSADSATPAQRKHQ
jgi:hypothetical protein